jgi:hypothetical protein
MQKHLDQFTTWCLLDTIPYESVLGGSLDGVYISRGLNHPHIMTSFFQDQVMEHLHPDDDYPETAGY